MTDLPCIAAALHKAESALGSDNPRLDAEVLLAYVLDKPRSHLFAWPEKTLKKEQQQRFLALIAQRQKGCPIAYITGQREFWSLPLKVSPDTLIPRPETELLVEFTLAHIKASSPEKSPLRILDLGTGTGAIALAIASEYPKLTVSACDNSPAALSIAQQNAKLLHINNVRFVPSDWFSELKNEHFDVIVSNPPYIAEDDPHLHTGDVSHEPRNALVSGHNGLDAIGHIVGCAMPFLADNGMLVIEHSFRQGRAVRAILQCAGFVGVQSQRDLQKLERISFAYRGFHAADLNKL